MKHRPTLHGLLALVTLVALTVTLSACKQKSANTGDLAKVSDEVKAVLAKADAYDGTVDKVVSKCASCELGMEGQSAHALTVADYKMNFCSDKCKVHFGEDTKKSILAMTIPE